MATIEYSVAGQQIVVTKDEKLVENTIGIYTVGFTFDAASWGDFTQKTAVFVHEDYPDIPPYEVPIDDGEAPIPASVLKYGNIMIGVYGSTQTQQYPTIWAPAKRVWPGAGPGVEPPEDPVFGMVVRTAPQELTEEQQEIARTNIGAAPEVIPDSTPGNITVIGSNNNIVDGGFKATYIFPVGSASGAVATFSDGADGLPIKSMTVQIKPVQAGTGDPSPSNVRAISGWTGAKISDAPANLLIKSAVTDGYYINDTNGNLASYNTWFASDYIKVTAGKSYRSRQASSSSPYSYSDVANGNNYYAFYDANFRYLSGGKNAGMTAPTGAVWLRMSTLKTLKDYLVVCDVDDISLFATRSDYKDGNTYTATFPTEAGTVYDALIIVHEDGSGTLTAGTAYLEPGASDINRFNGQLYATKTAIASMTGGTHPSTLICNYFKTADGNTFDDRMYLYNGYIYFRSSVAYDTVAEFLAARPLQIVYPIEPVTYQLTAEQVQILLFGTLKGINNVWADTGDVSIEYYADPALFVEQKTTAIKKTIAYVQNDFTAVQQYLVNDLVYVGDTLYIVTSAISQGATMTPNTNCSETTLNAVIKSLR